LSPAQRRVLARFGYSRCAPLCRNLARCRPAADALPTSAACMIPEAKSCEGQGYSCAPHQGLNLPDLVV
jgi:hypothetical protein